MLFKPGNTFYWEDKLFECLYFDQFSAVLREYGEITTYPVKAEVLFSAYMDGGVTAADDMYKTHPIENEKRFSDLHLSQQKIVNDKLDFIRLLKAPDTNTKNLNQKIQELAVSLRLKTVPSISSIYRWKDIYEESGENPMSLIDNRCRLTKGIK